MIQQIIDSKPHLQKYLFRRGFLITDCNDLKPSEFPFYGKWTVKDTGSYKILLHQDTLFQSIESNGCIYFIIGHAYNPFTMDTDEKTMLERISSGDFAGLTDELTGIFLIGRIKDRTIDFCLDASGIQSACCGTVNGSFFLSSHSQLVADVRHLEQDEFIKELTAYKWYPRVMGGYMPADLTPFPELKRVVPNNLYSFVGSGDVSHKRFYPLRNENPGADYDSVISEAADILKRNMELALKKFPSCAQSLTGGIDSNTTFAAANGHYGSYRTFSYLSAEKEVPDCNAAQTIADHFGVKHTKYIIPECKENLTDYKEKAEIIRHCNGYIACEKDNELRKRIYLEENCDFDVEIKSWVSETIRGYWYKHFGRKQFPALSGKLYRNIYKIFLLNRTLAHKTDKLFDRYIDEYEMKKIPDTYLPADIYCWEVMWGSWGSMNISEMKFCFDIDIIYNNRKFLDAVLNTPLEYRINDKVHLDMKRILNKELYEMNIRVVNLYETDSRSRMLNAIFNLNRILP